MELEHLQVDRVVLGSGECIEGPAVITIDGDRIKSVSSGAEWQTRYGDSDSSVTSYDGLTALPGFIDGHVHFSGLPITTIYPELRGTRFETMVEKTELDVSVPDGIRLLACARNAWNALSAGITTARDCGSRGEVGFWLRRGIELGLTSGPRVLVAGPIVTMTGGHGCHHGGEADGPDETRKLTRHLIKKGVDFIKTAATGGLASATTNPGHSGYSTEELRAIVEEAHRRDRKVTAHILARNGVRQALDAGLDMFEHNWFLEPDGSTNYDADLVERMVEQNVVCCPTPVTEYRLAEMIEEKDEQGKASEEELRLGQWSAEVVQRNIENVMRMVDQGVKIIHGTDAGVSYIPFTDYALGLELLVRDGGMSTRDAISSATRDAAEAIGLDAGDIEPGKLADICLIEGDPIRDISAIRNVRHVYKEGQRVFSAEMS